MGLEIIDLEDVHDMNEVVTRFYWRSIFDETLPPEGSTCLVLYETPVGGLIDTKVFHDGCFYPRYYDTEHNYVVAYAVIDGYADLLLGSWG